jgi:hypothetical protein
MFVVTIASPHDPNDAFAHVFADPPPAPDVEFYANKADAFARAAALWDANDRMFGVQEITICGVITRTDYPHASVA